jgi:hypothetical protein
MANRDKWSEVYTRIFCRLAPQSNRMHLVMVSHVVFLRVFPVAAGTLLFPNEIRVGPVSFSMEFSYGHVTPARYSNQLAARAKSMK